MPWVFLEVRMRWLARFMLNTTLILMPFLAACSLASTSEEQAAVARAKEIYLEKKRAAVDMSAGPCLAENLIPDWVVDVAHNPREPIDDRPENQCLSYREGRAHHFVELDPEGNLIRAR